MRIKALIAATVAMSLAATPALANPASSLSIAGSSSARAGAPGDHSSRLAGSATLPIVLALAIIGVGIYIAVDDNDDSPDSP